MGPRVPVLPRDADEPHGFPQVVPEPPGAHAEHP